MVVISSGLGPLMHGYANERHRSVIMGEDLAESINDTGDGEDEDENENDGNDDDGGHRSIVTMIRSCLDADESSNHNAPSITDDTSNRPDKFRAIGFPGGPFKRTAPNFHMYDLAKMFGDA